MKPSLHTHAQYQEGMPRFSGQAGFSLIWMSILITVASIIMVSVLPGNEAGDYNAKTQADMKKLMRVEEAMRSFMATNLRRPCPASGTYAINTANFGKEAANPGSCTGGTPAVQLGPETSDTNCTNNTTGCIVSGVIPTRSLGLPDEFMFDSYGRRFTYVVDVRATQTKTCISLEAMNWNGVPTGTGGLIIKDAAGTTVDNTMYAFIQHGPSGYGAFPEQGSDAAHRIFSASTDANEMTNAGVDSTCVSGKSDFSSCTNSDFTNVRIRDSAILPFTSGGNLDTGFDNMLYYRGDIKNTCCLGPVCTPVGFLANGSSAFYAIGYAMAIGDINNDGTNDLITGSNDCAAVLLGKKNAQQTGSYADPTTMTPDFKICDNVDFAVPSSIAVGDVNGDGIPDIIIGVSPATVSGNAHAGKVFVVFGEPESFWSQHTSYTLDATAGTGLIDGVHGFEIDGVSANDSAGYSVAVGSFLGSTNGSQPVADILIGARQRNSNAGAAYVVFGGAAQGTGGNWLPGTAKSFSLSALNGSTGVNGTAGIELDGTTSSTETAGSSVAMGDINGDGYADAMIAAPTANHGVAGGSVYVVLGGSGTWTSSQASPIMLTGLLGSGHANGANGFRLDGRMADEVGLVPANGGLAVGDVNGDGVKDLIIGAPFALHGGTPAGTVYVVFGGSGSWNASYSLSGLAGATGVNGTNGFEIDGPSGTSYYIGRGVASGDVNGDGKADIGIAQYFPDATFTIIFGGTGPKSGGAWTTPITLTANNSWLANGGSSAVNGFVLNESITGTAAGGTFIAIGDITLDGKSEVMAGAPNASPGGLTDAGSIYVLYGRAANKWPLTYNLNGL